MNADDKRIQLDTKTIDFFWLLSFSAWRAIEVYSPALLVATWTGMPLDQALKIDAERGQYELDYKQGISTAQSLIAAEQTTQISWPADIPHRPQIATLGGGPAQDNVRPRLVRPGLRAIPRISARDVLRRQERAVDAAGGGNRLL
ncbi:hypothetical protein [Bradyrhizobium sp. RT5a]|uniref:hypothetical protein n=1 Tax=unclassified Bradyrhizobium TaxID=2631580 RepID=UPI003399EFC3